MHLKRWITGLTALPFLIYLIYKGGVPFVLLVTVGGLLSLWEYFRIVFSSEEGATFNIFVVWGFVLVGAIIWAAYLKGPDLVMLLIACNLLFSALFSLFKYKDDPQVMESIKKQIQGIIYIPVLISFLILIRNDSQGMTWIFVVLSIVFAGDITALYVGTFFGRHKLCPAVSPGKTIEGSAGGLLANIIVGAIGKHFFLPQLSWGLSILCFIAICVAGQVGDLYESELKRSSKIKDSGGLLPGHGGFLDRIDALLFAAPVAYIFKMYIL
ncbi:MAG: phosphatidate cytidylyltransferase [Deltaproteobacteria bacterium]|nr:phosphatidate cytidylyltransferase [Deltaproteobacteria bacterium]